MYNTIVYHINGVHSILIEKSRYFHMIDHTVLKTEKELENSEYVDFFDQESLARLDVLAKPFTNLIISSSLTLQDDQEIDAQISKVCNTVFASLKNSYILLMQQRNLKLWIIEPSVYFTDHKYIAEVNSFKAGIKALSSIVALELAKKKINVNYIENCGQHQEFIKFIEWSGSQQSFYMTAQNIPVHDL
jgi:hypothetical protein